MAAKLTSELIDQLAKSDVDGYVSVVLELAKNPDQGTEPEDPQTSRAERIAAMKQSFEQSLAPVAKAVGDIGGEITNGAWINRTARARVPANKVSELANQENIVAIDLPRTLSPDVAKSDATK